MAAALRARGIAAGDSRPVLHRRARVGGGLRAGRRPGLARADEEGFLYVVDRKNDMIISGGENVYCAEVEDILSDHPAIAELTVEALRECGTGRLARFKLPTILHVVPARPRNASGKVLKTELREQFR